MGSRLTKSHTGLVLLAALFVLLLIPACGTGPSTSPSGLATVHGTVPVTLLPIPDGVVLVEIFPAADPQAQPVATLTTSTSHSGWFSVEVPPGVYIVRASGGRAQRQSQRVEAAAGGDVEARFAQL
jgi:hypothetical protein